MFPKVKPLASLENSHGTIPDRRIKTTDCRLGES